MITVRPTTDDTRHWVRSVVGEYFNSLLQLRPGRVWEDVSLLPGFVAEDGAKPRGFALYEVRGDECELVVIRSVVENVGAGTALVGALREEAVRQDCKRLQVFTVNDNINAIRFYQRRGFDLIALHREAMEEVRRIKPDVPILGEDGIPMRHMLEFEIVL
jgi:GNAT superfamily N-acetyltransferase